MSVSAFVVVLLICQSASARMAGKIGEDEISRLAVPRVATAPKIDGRIGEQEWRQAAAISGVTTIGRTELRPRPVTFYLAWDKGHLYLAYRVYLEPHYKPRVRGRGPGQAIVFDNGAELVVKPMGQNVPPENTNCAYKFFFNGLGYTGDLMRLELGQKFKNWMPNFKTAAGTTEPGSAPNGGSWMEVEMSSTPEDFQLDGPNRVGDQWRVMMGINTIIEGAFQARIPAKGGYFQSGGAGYTRLHLVENTPAVQFTMNSLDNLATTGTASMRISAFNPSEKMREVSVNVNVADAIKQQKKLKLSGNETTAWSLDEKLPDDIKEGKFNVEVTQGKQTLLSYTAFFTTNPDARVLTAAKKGDPNKFPFKTQFNPVRKWLQVRGDAYYLPEPSAAVALHYRVYPEGDPDTSLHEGTVTDAIHNYFRTDVLGIPQIRPGKYVVEGRLQLKDGSELGPVTRTFVKKDEAETYPNWWGTDYGDIDQVLPPFEPITETEDSRSGWFTRSAPRFACWGREYELSSLGLPLALMSQGENVLVSAARIVVVRDGREIPVELKNADITSHKPWRVRFQGKATGAGLDFMATGWLEQDGLVYAEMTYGPENDESVEIDALRIEYPLSRGDAECLVCLGPGGNFAANTTMIFPEDKQGQLWSSLDTGRPGSQMTVGNFYPTVWIGNDKRGLMWWSDTDRGWFPVNDKPAHEAIRTDDAVVFRNNIVSEPVKLEGRRTIQFSYNATPFKKFTENWREVGATEDGTFQHPHRSPRVDARGVKVNPRGTQQNWIHPNSTSREEWDELYKKWKKQADSIVRGRRWQDPYSARNGINFGHMSFALHGYGRKSIFSNIYKYFGPAWEASRDTWNKSYRDYAMYLMDMTLDKGGVRSTYWDITFPRIYSQPISGLGYYLPDGRIQPEYNGWNVRRFYMRLQALMHKYDLFPNGAGAHSTNDYHLVAMPWIDSVLDGEANLNVALSGKDWVDTHGVARMRSMSSPHNWGVPICWMSNIEGKGSGLAEFTQTQWVWMHDSWRNPYCRPRSMPDAALDWGLCDEDVVYHPYWRNPYVSSENEDILVSLWRWPDRIMLGVFNYNSGKKQTASISIDLDKLDLIPRKKWQEFLRVRTLWAGDDGGAELNFHKRTLTLENIAPHHLRIIGIRRY